MNEIAWGLIFLHSGDKKILAEAIKRMEHVVQIAPNYFPALDTYANLLYKIGEKQNAIAWSNKAIEATKTFIEHEKEKGEPPRKHVLIWLQDYQVNLDKMKQDMPTWIDTVTVL